MTPTLVVVGHEASRTGSPIALLTFLRWLRAETDVDLEVLLWRGGPLEEDFRALAPTRVLGTLDGSTRREALERNLPAVGLGRLATSLETRRVRSRAGPAGGQRRYYLNSAAAGNVLPALGSVDVVAAHVHELDVGLRRSLPDDDAVRRLLDTPTGLVAVSDAVRQMLVDRFGVDEARVRTHHEMVDVDRVLGAVDGVEGARAALGIPDGQTLVVGCGQLQARKGPDLFVQVAAAVTRRRPGRDVTFVWVGGDPDDLEGRRLQHDVAAAGLGDVVRLLPSRPDPLPLLGAADLFLLTSREDPYPIVCLEAGALGVPVVAFANGGVAELVEDDGGHVVPFARVEAMADAVVALADDPRRRVAQGEVLRRRVRDRHDVRVAAPRLWADLQRWMG